MVYERMVCHFAFCSVFSTENNEVTDEQTKEDFISKERDSEVS